MVNQRAILPALALAGVMAMLFGTEARSQTANDVVCNKCVEKGDLAKNAVVRGRIKKNAVTGRKVKDGTIEIEDLSPAVQQVIADLQAQVAALQALADLAAFITVEEVETDLNGDGVIDPATERLPRVLFEGVNVQIANGDVSETTNTRNGLGNLIVGYNEPRVGNPEVCSAGQFENQNDCETNGHVWDFNHKSGSHNLVVGRSNAYSQSGGVVFGSSNVVNRNGASVTGGFSNIASGNSSSVSGGAQNTASGPVSSVSAGQGNTASNERSSVTGGAGNTASGFSGSVHGGFNNEASGGVATVSAGLNNTASGNHSSVSGGQGNEAAGDRSTVSGGSNRTAPDNDDWVAGALFENN